jgi:hypothetical protein
MSSEREAAQEVNIKITDEELKGHYANLLRVTHTKDEFVLDFIHVVPPQGIVTARVITSPAHLKRTVRALAANLARYEKTFGVLPEPPEPDLEDNVH